MSVVTQETMQLVLPENTAGARLILEAPEAMSDDAYAWAKRDARGKAFGSSVEFLLPNGAALSPDAAWVANEKLLRLTKDQRRKFLRLTPDFVAEIMSPSGRLPAAQEKMLEWLENGVCLGWLIDGDARVVYIYRPKQPVETCRGVVTLAAAGPLEGSTIDLADLWAGL